MNYLNLDNQIEKYCAEKQILGVIRITVRDEVKYQKSVGFADISSETPFTDESMFALYSISKPFCTIGLMKLKDKGMIDIDVHPSKYVPEAAGFHEKTTVRHLLHHISGLPDFAQNNDFAEKNAPGHSSLIREHIKLLSEYPSLFEPGTGGYYANINFALCAVAIENITGMPYAEYMKKEVFEPLGMKTAIVDRENLVIPNRVKGYELEDGKLKETGRSYNWMFGAGDVIGTVDDVYCLNKAIKHRLLLREDTWNEVLTPSPLNSMGMGCTVTDWHGKHRITHNGGHVGFRTLHVQLPEDDFDIIILSNSGFGNARYDLSEIIHDAFYGEDGIIEKEIPMDTGYIDK